MSTMADRPETDPCEVGTLGCSVDHTADARVTDTECETW